MKELWKQSMAGLRIWRIRTGKGEYGMWHKAVWKLCVFLLVFTGIVICSRCLGGKEKDQTVSEEVSYVDEEMYRVIKETIDNIDFDADFQPGDTENTALFKAQFKKFLEGESTVRINRTGEEVYIYDLGEFGTNIEFDEFDSRGYTYYFFDINGDAKPELCVTDKARFTYVFQYDEADNQVVLWEEYISGTIFFMGTRKLGFAGGWSGDGFIRLDKDGGREYSVRFKAMGGSVYLEDGDGYGYFISLPEYVELSDDRKARAVYDEADERYYFRVTKEQYMELTEKYFRAVKDADAAIKDVTYTYEELFETAYELTEEKKLFLQEHLYGQWKFSERIVEIDEDNNFQYGAKPNLSDMGVEELKKSARIMYEDAYVGFTVDIGQNSFTYAQDMYLFAVHGGFSWSSNPVYRFAVVEEDTITLKDVYNMDGYKIPAEGMENFIHVTYFTRPDRNDSGVYGSIFTYFGSDIYIDPDDFDTIYIDFCGLWKMERDDNYYGTDGKSEY